MSSWQFIEEVHSAMTKGTSPAVPWSECVSRLLEVLKEFETNAHKEKEGAEPSQRDQVLVLLTVLINLSNPTEHAVKVDVPLQEVSTVMVNLITSQEDPYVTNLATKCLCQCLASKQSQACDGDWFASVLQPCMGCLRSGERLGPVIDLFRLIFSKRSMATVGGDGYDVDKVRVWCVQEIIRLWRPLVDDVITRGLPESSSCDEGSGSGDPTLISLLSLWVKLIKTHHNHLSSDLLGLDEQSFAPLQTTTVKLVDIITRRRLPPVVFDKICDVLNRTLLYGSSTDQFQYGTGQGHGFSVDLGADILRSVQMGLLDLVPLDTGERGFIGIHSPTDEQEPLLASGGSERDKVNWRSLRKVALLVLKSCAIITRSATYAGISLGAVELVLETLWGWAQQCAPANDPHHWLVVVFGDQDDYLVEAMLCLMDIYTTIRWKSASPTDNKRRHESDPHAIFLHFLQHTSFDHTVLLDLLTSPETCFLLYLVRYLHYALHTWEVLADICLTWKPIAEEDQHQTPRPVNSISPLSEGTKTTPRVSESTCSPDSELHISTKQVCYAGDSTDDSMTSVIDPTLPKSVPKGSMRSPSPKVTAVVPPPDVILTPPEDETQKDIVPKSPAKSLSKEAGTPTSPKRALRLVEYSDESLSESEGEENAEGATDCRRLSAKQLSVDLDLDSGTSDHGRSLTASLTSLTSVTSDLEMPSDLQDVGMETDVEEGALDGLMAVLIRLRLVIERLDDKGLFPYNASALRRLLCQTEALYDGEEI